MLKILRVPPAGDIQVRNLGRTDVAKKGLLLPELVVVGMVDEIVPGRYLVVEILLVDVRQHTEIQVPLVRVGAVEFKVRVGLFGSFEQGGVFEAVAEAEGAVVMEIVAQEP